jgi:hypothetical protein
MLPNQPLVLLLLLLLRLGRCYRTSRIVWLERPYMDGGGETQHECDH